MLSLFKLLFCGQFSRGRILNHLREAIHFHSSSQWWDENEFSLRRELELVTSQKNAEKAINHGKHHDPFYLQQLVFELQGHVR